MKNLALLLLFTIIISCGVYDSTRYRLEEIAVIEDILIQILQDDLLDFDSIRQTNERLIIFDSLGITTAYTREPTGYIVAQDGIKFSEDKIERNRLAYEASYNSYWEEESKFAPLRDGDLKPRRISGEIVQDWCTVELVRRDAGWEFDYDYAPLGHLTFSRVVLNWNYTTGYLYYVYIAGDNYCITSNIEVKKQDDRWVITKWMSGGIS